MITDLLWRLHQRLAIPYVVTSGILSLLTFVYLFTFLPQRAYAIANMATGRGMVYPLSDFVDNWFNYDERNWPKQSPTQMSETATDIAQFVADSIVPHAKYQVIGRSNELSPALFDMYIRQKRRSIPIPEVQPPAQVITIKILGYSPLITRDYYQVNQWVQYEIPRIEQDQELLQINSRVFSSLGVEVRVYQEIR